jgi:hypothetical protein
VTRKTRLEDRGREFTGAVPHMLLLISTAGAIAWAARTIYLDEVGSTHQFALMLTAIWAVYNAGMVGGAVRAVLTRAHRRSQYRFAARIPVRCEPLDAPGITRSTRGRPTEPDGSSSIVIAADRAAAGVHRSAAGRLVTQRHAERQPTDREYSGAASAALRDRRRP